MGFRLRCLANASASSRVANSFGNHDNFIMDFCNRQDAEAFAKKLNEQTVPETYTYTEWRD